MLEVGERNKMGFKYYRKHRPKVHYFFWVALLVLCSSSAIMMMWAHGQNGLDLTVDIGFQIFMMFVCYTFARVWKHWIDNSEEYEKLQRARFRKITRKMGQSGRGRKREEKNEEDSKE